MSPKTHVEASTQIAAAKEQAEEFLSGFEAQRYQLRLDQGFEESKGIMRGVIERTVAQSIGGDERRIDGIQTSYMNIMFKHILLPVWIGAYRFQGKVFQVVVNARTGEVQGERPYSVAKIVLLVVAIIIVIIIVASLSHHGGGTRYR